MVLFVHFSVHVWVSHAFDFSFLSLAISRVWLIVLLGGCLGTSDDGILTRRLFWRWSGVMFCRSNLSEFRLRQRWSISIGSCSSHVCFVFDHEICSSVLVFSYRASLMCYLPALSCFSWYICFHSFLASLYLLLIILFVICRDTPE